MGRPPHGYGRRRSVVSVADMRSPPPAVKVVLALMVLTTLPLLLLPDGISDRVAVHLARNLFAGGVLQTGRLYTIVTALFVHGGFVHLLFNGLWILTLGPAVHRHLGPARFALLFVLSGVGGAALFTVTHWGESVFVVGASGPVFGLIGAGAYVLTAGAETFARRARQILHYTALFMLLNFGFAALAASGAFGAPLRVSWEDHLGGFLVGLALFPLLRR